MPVKATKGILPKSKKADEDIKSRMQENQKSFQEGMKKKYQVPLGEMKTPVSNLKEKQKSDRQKMFEQQRKKYQDEYEKEISKKYSKP